MGEFVDVMLEAQRLCDSMLKPGSETVHFCNECPLGKGSAHRDNCFVTYSVNPRNFAKAEKAVMEWAKQHPRMTWEDLMNKYDLFNPKKVHAPVPYEIAKIAMREMQ